MTTFDKELCQINRKEHSHPAAYTIFHNATGKMYVGSTRDLYVRINKHRTSLENGNHRRKNFQEAYDKNSKLTLAFVKAESEEHARNIEQKMLDVFMSADKLFNVSPDAKFANKGVALSEENKDILRQKTTAQFASQEARDRHSEITKKMWSDPEYRRRQAEGKPAGTADRPGQGQAVAGQGHLPAEGFDQLDHGSGRERGPVVTVVEVT